MRFSSLAIITVLLFSNILGCRTQQVRLERYKIDKPDGDWKNVKSGSADYAWYNSKIGATIYVDSNCEQRFEDRPLHDSLYSMTAGIRSKDEPLERALFLDGREAVMLQTSGNLDGVDIQMAVVALAKNQCLFDFVYITRPENFSKGFGDFHQMLYTFESRTGWNNVLESPSVREQE